jgi:hypothetical protein
MSMDPMGGGPAFATGQPETPPESAGGACSSCGRELPPPDLEAVAAAIDETLSLETGQMVARTAWAGRPPDGISDALLAWLPSVRARRQIWERGQQLWTERMTQALSGPCEDCLGEPMVPSSAATLIQTRDETDAGGRPMAPPPEEPATAAMSAYSDAAAPQSTGLADAKTSAMPTFADVATDLARQTPIPPADEESATSAASAYDPAGRGGAPPEQPLPGGDEHEAHTVILPSMPRVAGGPRLAVIEGPVHGRHFSIGRQLTTIGRSIGCHITVDADAVAYDHARVVRVADGWQIEPMGGAELYVNDEPVSTSHTLRGGDVIRIGPARLRFESAG